MSGSIMSIKNACSEVKAGLLPKRKESKLQFAKQTEVWTLYASP